MPEPQANDNVVHVLPVGDLHPHIDLKVCPCKPRVVMTSDAGGFVIVHNSYDGREHAEPDHVKEQCPSCSNAHPHTDNPAGT